MSGSLPCFSHISASHNLGPLRITLLIFLCRSINTLMPSNLMTLTRARPFELRTTFDNDVSPSIGEYRGRISGVARNLTGWGDAVDFLIGRTSGLTELS